MVLPRVGLVTGDEQYCKRCDAPKAALVVSRRFHDRPCEIPP